MITLIPLGRYSLSPDFPRLAGQHEDYLLRALLDYKLGNRKDPIMQGQVANLSKQDFADLAAWFSSQKGLETRQKGLETRR